MLKFKTSCAVLAYLSSNLLNEVGLSLFRYFEVGLRVCDIVVKKFTFAISSPDEFLLFHLSYHRTSLAQPGVLTAVSCLTLSLHSVIKPKTEFNFLLQLLKFRYTLPLTLCYGNYPVLCA